MSKKILKWAGIIIIACIIYLTGYLVGHKNLVFENSWQPTIINTELRKPKEVDFSLFWEVFDKVKNDYFGEIDSQKMIYGAIKGALGSLGDPYTGFLESKENNELISDLKGEFEGIGAEIGVKNDGLIIVAPLEGSPAKAAGLKSGDEILKIDDQIASELDFNDAIQKIRGKAGTEVTLLIKKQGLADPKEIKIKRAKIKVDPVRWEKKDDNVTYLKINQFGDNTTELTQKYANEIVNTKPRAIILDLRNNPGGYLDSAVDVASLFVDNNSVITYEQNKKGKKKEIKATLKPILKDIPVVVLINEGSASGSEIVAGALKDLRGAKLIGKTTFGKGSVQTFEEMKNNTALRLTVAHWLTPKGTEINKKGIKPDIEIEENKDITQDDQLNKAMEILK